MADIISLKIENFQSHENTVLDFDKGLNVILGPSDQGKSAIVRAIKWLLYNEPRGTDFIRQGTTTARVTIEMSNGYIIVRERSKSKNRYMVTNPENETAVFEGFGNEIPEEVIKAHGIPKVLLDNDKSSSLNISDQLEGPFMLSESGSIRAKALGRLNGVHIIDRALRNCIVDLKRENQTSDRIGIELENNIKKLEDYKYIYIIEEKIKKSTEVLKNLTNSIEKLEKLENKRLSKIENQNELFQIVNSLKTLVRLDECELNVKNSEIGFNKTKQLEYFQKNLIEIEIEASSSVEILSITRNLQEYESILSLIKINKLRFEKMNNCLNSFQAIDLESSKHLKILEDTKDAEKSEYFLGNALEKMKRYVKLIDIEGKLKYTNKEISKVEVIYENYKEILNCEILIEKINVKGRNLTKLSEIKQQFDVNINNIIEGDKYLEKNKQMLMELLNNYSTILKKIGKCPLCGFEINEEKIKEIIEEYREVH